MNTEDPLLSRLCVHTITTKPLDFVTACKAYSRKKISGITIWRDAIENISPKEVIKLVQDHNLEIVSYCRGGFFPHPLSSHRQAAIDDNIRMIEEAAAIGAPMLVLVCGAHPDQPLEVSRQQILEGISKILPRAEQLKVKLAVEPLHPMYADDRSAITTLTQANNLVENIPSDWLGVAIDVYHLWWDPELKKQIERCGKNKNIFAFHVCDWLTPTNHMLLDRGLMGEGCINIKEIRNWVESNGFRGFIEVEIFSERWWATDQEVFLDAILEGFKKHC